MVPVIAIALILQTALATGANLEEPAATAEYQGRAYRYHCHAVTLDSKNLRGILIQPANSSEGEQPVMNARILYETGRQSRIVEMKLPEKDAEILRHEISAIMERLRSKPIEIRTARSKSGDCEVIRVVG